jgi:hypothetical protein
MAACDVLDVDVGASGADGDAVVACGYRWSSEFDGKVDTNKKLMHLF